ncbi:MAG TPA: hypothetical protein PK528_10230 [Syntrophorhabdus sp.]|nr:hypothetical protein [Deltaproteobacteria bacterium]HPW69424.1 hypothetical protein [Deltaproteobacteria bacterium]HQO63978.1 hypothetical protein [Syntrophorhabdus sp.]
MNCFRKPKSVYSQVECVLHGIFAYGKSKNDSPEGIRSYGTRKTYGYEAHRFAHYLTRHGAGNIFDAELFAYWLNAYLMESLDHFITRELSLQTFETRLAALAKLEHAINTFIEEHDLPYTKISTEDIREEASRLARRKGRGLKRSSRQFSNRAYPDPVLLIRMIENPTHCLQASLQYEGGLRTEGVGAASNGLSNPLTSSNLGGLIPDPVTGKEVGLVSDVREKGGKLTDHLVTPDTYHFLAEYIRTKRVLQSPYEEYLASIKKAARITGQYSPGRGTHAFKHNFAQRRYLECVNHGMTHEQSLQQTSLELSHFRYYETYAYTTR